MQAAIRRMGNSAAILLPRPVLAHLQVTAGDRLDLELLDGRVVLTPAQQRPRAGWAESAKALAEAGDDGLEWPELDGAGEDPWSG